MSLTCPCFGHDFFAITRVLSSKCGLALETPDINTHLSFQKCICFIFIKANHSWQTIFGVFNFHRTEQAKLSMLHRSTLYSGPGCGLLLTFMDHMPGSGSFRLRTLAELGMWSNSISPSLVPINFPAKKCWFWGKKKNGRGLLANRQIYL